MSDNKVVVVAGAGPGNGAALEQRFAAAGRQVAMLSRDQEHAEALAAKITSARGYACDVSDEASVKLDSGANIRARQKPDFTAPR